MDSRHRHLWFWGFVLFAAVVAAAGAVHRHFGSGGGFETSAYVILALAAGWFGALAGGVADWKKYRRSPLAPLLGPGFGWFYSQMYWLRFALVFALAWLLFVLVCFAVAMAVGAYEDAMMFLTPEGAAIVALFVMIFGLEGAMVGFVADVAGHVFRKPDGPADKEKKPR